MVSQEPTQGVTDKGNVVRNVEVFRRVSILYV